MLCVCFFQGEHHVMRHKIRESYMEGINGDSRAELEADAFARDFLIPPVYWSRFVEARDWSPSTVVRFAEEIGIAAGIVVGRMHYEGLIPYNQLSNLKTRFVWVEHDEE